MFSIFNIFMNINIVYWIMYLYRIFNLIHWIKKTYNPIIEQCKNNK